MITVDIACDLMDEDETGYVWAFLDDARDSALIEPGAIVVAGDTETPAIAEVVDIVEKAQPVPLSTCACSRGRSRTTWPSCDARSRQADVARVLNRPSAACRERQGPGGVRDRGESRPRR